MRRLLAWAFNLSAVLSLLLFVGVCVLWVRCLRRLEAIRYLGDGGRLVELETHPGGVDASWLTWQDDFKGPYALLTQSLRPRRGWSASSHADGSSEALDLTGPSGGGGPSPSDYTTAAYIVYQWSPPPHLLLGFGWEGPRTPATPSALNRARLTFPFWLPVAVLSLLPLRRLLVFGRERRAARRLAAGFCTSCGYDLRATRGRCPECGHVPKQA